jgi:hypothetical protein
MFRLYRLFSRIWKKRWHVSLAIVFVVLEYSALTAVHKAGFSFTGFISFLKDVPSTPISTVPRIVVEAPLTPLKVAVRESTVAPAPVAGTISAAFPVMKTVGVTVNSAGTSVSESPHLEPPTIEAQVVESPDIALRVPEVSVVIPTKKECFISSYSNDGIGHQMEAKISCLATALILNSRNVTQGRWTYIHQPVNELQHGQDPAAMEELFGLSKILADALYDPETMAMSTREIAACLPHPENMIQIFNALCPGNNKTTEKAIVFTADNCWDFFYCQNEPLPDEWYTHVVPLLRTTILQGASYVQNSSRQNDALVPNKTERIPGRCFIVMHIRLGDADDRQMRGDWIQAVWRNLLMAQELVNQQRNEGNKISTPFLSYQLAIHSDGERDTVLNMLKFSVGKVVLMEDYSTPDTIDDREKAIVSLYCSNEERTRLMTTLNDMLTADIFITSDSALSHTASLLRDASLDGPTVHPPTTGYEGEGREQLGTILGRFFLKKFENDTAMLLWSNHEKWKAVDASFWTNLFKVYLSRSMVTQV